MWLWISISGGLHVLVFLGALFGGGIVGPPGGGLGDGDGFGGASVELEIQAAPEEGIHGARPAGAPDSLPQPAASEVEPTPSETEPVLEGELEIRAEETPRERRREREQAQEAREEVPDQRNEHGDADSETVAAPGPGERPSGTGANDSTAGTPGGDPAQLILGSAGAIGNSTTAQRALLPTGSSCDDPVTGTWRAQKYSNRGWARFTLRVQRNGEQVTGTITSHMWSGPPSDPRPGPCTAFGFDHTWVMEARGRFDGTQMTFNSHSLRLTREDCPQSGHNYAADNFRGRVDVEREVFDAVNNDGAYDIDEPYLFRRVSCE
jgi:hypothetical protein